MKQIPGFVRKPLPWNRVVMPGQWHQFGDIDVGMVTFTSEIWKVILEEHNARNRKPGNRAVLSLAHAMTAGQWLLTGETIIFSSEKQCLNGQQRGMACRLSGVPFTSLVAVGVTPDAFRVMDQHRRRSLAQVLAVEGEKSTNVLAGGLNYLAIFFARGSLDQAGLKVPFTTDDYLKLLDEHPGIADVAIQVAGVRGMRLFGSTSLVVAFRYLAGLVNEPLAERLVKVMTEITIPETDEWNGVRLLAKQLVARQKEAAKLTKTQVAARLLKVWDALLYGRHLKVLQWRNGEDFPKFAGWSYEGRKPVAAVRTECPHYPGPE